MMISYKAVMIVYKAKFKKTTISSLQHKLISLILAQNKLKTSLNKLNKKLFSLKQGCDDSL